MESSTQWYLGLVCFVNMACVGTMYALSILQAELSRLLGVGQHMSFAPFATASLGLSVGVATAASQISSIGACAVTARGTMVWGLAVLATGHFLAMLNYWGILASLLLGGVGVGWTYLAVVLLVSQAFPNNAVARSAVGPLGFSSGTAACIVGSVLLNFSFLSASSLGGVLQGLGVTFFAIGLATAAVSPSKTRQSDAPVQKTRNVRQLFYCAFLFLNALPGMVAFSALIPVALYQQNEAPHSPLILLSYAMSALAAGGVLGPPLSSWLGADQTFGLLFCLRGLLLIAWACSSSLVLALASLIAVLFGHGTGFSTLPGLIKSELGEPERFPTVYGQILMTWGFAGVAASTINGLLLSASGNGTNVALILGAAMLPIGAITPFIKLGRK